MFLTENGSETFAGFTLECGEVIPLRLAYQWVVPSGPVRRRVLLCHGITSSHQAYLPGGQEAECADAGWGNGFIGPGKALDPQRGDMIICINTLGSWFGSSGAGNNSGGSFPALTMSDMACAQWRLLDHLGIATLDMVVGYSFGGYLAIEMLSQHGERMQSVLQLASGFRGRADPKGVAAIEAMIAMPVAQRRPAVAAWRRELLERYGYVRWLRHEYGGSADEYLQREIDAWTAMVSLDALLSLRAAAAAFDRTTMSPAPSVTAIRWDSDPLFPPWQPGEAPACRTLTLSSPYGHFAPLAQPHLWIGYLTRE